jgi:uncharacterized RDD family membrane protein YckC
MRCPKCHYVSFDGQSRCRNCGYDFSLVQPAADPVDLPTRTEPASATPLADLSLKMDEPSGETPSVLDRYIASPSAPAGAGPGGAGAGAGSRGGADAGVSAGFGAAAGAGAGAAAARAAWRGARAGATTETESDPLDLPLFSPAAPGAPGAASSASRASASRAAPDDRPLVSGATPPRPPLSVRRTTGEIPRARPRVTPQSTPQRVEEPRLELEIPEPSMLPDFEEDAEERVDMLSSRDMTRGATPAATAAGSAGAASRAPVIASRGRAESSTDTRGDSRQQARSSADAYADADTTAAAAIDTDLAPFGTRVIAGLLDVVFMAVVDAFVLYFTLRVTGVTWGDLRRLPVAPLAGFLALLNGGYLTMFTAASGQTMGKMLMGVKVVTARGGPVPFGSAVVRALVWLLTIVPAGVGFIPAFLTSDRRALHDRFADTKVIKTSD